MRRVVGLAMVADGALQALGVAEVLPSLLDRSLRDQALVAAHVLAGAGLVFGGSRLLKDPAQTYGGRTFSSGVDGAPIAGAEAPASVRPVMLALTLALALALIETTWFNWTGTVLRALYTAAALYVVTRKTTLPTT